MSFGRSISVPTEWIQLRPICCFLSISDARLGVMGVTDFITVVTITRFPYSERADCCVADALFLDYFRGGQEIYEHN